MVVARPTDGGGFEVITTEKEMVRLGEGSGEMKELSGAAIDRGVAALTRMRDVANSYDAAIAAVATSAVREAENRHKFISRVKTETGIDVEVISGFEEARLIHLGVLQALPVFDKQIMLVDIGGGSTEFLQGRGSEVVAARSIKLGAIRLTDRFFSDGEATTKSIKKCRAHVANRLAAVVSELNDFDIETAIGSSGTISAIAMMISAARGDEVRSINGVSFTVKELNEIVETVSKTPLDRRNSIAGLDERRADIIVGGSLLLSEIFKAFGLKKMTVSSFALREGVLFDRMHTGNSEGDNRLRDLRRTNAVRLARQLDPDAAHAETAAKLALKLFDETRALHKLDDSARDLLEMAAIVHNVGLFISHAAHHKHTYYVVRHSEQLTGFTERERELVALIARYHRRGLPSDKHPEFAQLSDNDKQLVRILAGLLRIGIGLDRSHRRLVTDLDGHYEKKQRRLTIEPIADPGVDIDLELYSAQERAELLATVLDIDVAIASETAN